MGARTSPEMLIAQSLLRQGFTAYAAAKQSGISQGAISKSKACQEIIRQRNDANAAAPSWLCV